MILYEYPFNERMRIHLRLEQLFLRLDELARRETTIDHHYALATIFEIMDVGARSDLKTEVLRELERQKQVLNGYRGNPAISEEVLNGITGELQACFSSLNSLCGKVGQPLIEDEWLMSIRSRISLPGATFAFDLPAYHAWQHLAADVRQQDLRGWMASLMPLAEAVSLLLRLVRNSGTAQKVLTCAGAYQQVLPQGRTFQLLRLRLNSALGLIPEISCTHLMVSVRLLCRASNGRLQTCRDNSMFELTLCC